MLNLYLAPRRARLFCPEEIVREALIARLQELGVIGEEADGAFPPGPAAKRLFQRDPHDELLPAELTFDSLSVHLTNRPHFLPERQWADRFEGTACRQCGDRVDLEDLDQALARLGYFPVERFVYECPACRNPLSLEELDFGQHTAIARFWIYIEGAATSRLSHHALEQLTKVLGVGLVVVPEVLDDSDEGVVSFPRPSKRRR